MKKASTITAKFLRYKASFSNTKLWKDCDDSIQKSMLQVVKFDTKEEPVLAFYKSDLYWWLLTNCKIIISLEQKIEQVYFSDIDSVEFDDIIQGRITKEACRSLQIITRPWHYVLEVEERSWTIVYTILTFVIAK